MILNDKICTDEKKEELLNEIKKYEPDLEVKLSTKFQVQFVLQSNNENISQILEIIENNKELYGIEDYSISSTSLEDVFLKVNSNIYYKDNYLKKENENNNNIKSNEIIDIQIPKMDISPTFANQLLIHLRRHFSGFWRLKSIHILNYIYCIFFLFVYIIIHVTILNIDPVTENKLDLIDLLESNDIFTNDEEYLKKSSIFKNSFNFKKINAQSNIENFIEEIYKNAYLNIGKSGIQVEKKINGIHIFNTEIPINKLSYIMANILLTTSSFFKNEYNINVEIFPEITYIQETYIEFNKLNVMILFGAVSSSSYIFFLMFFLSERIKE